MTYLVPRTIRRYRRRQPALSGWLEDAVGSILGLPSVGPSDESQCLDQANAQMAPFDAKTNDLAKNWQPTGFYRPEEIRTLVRSTLDVTQQAYATLTKAAQEPNASGDSITRASDDLARSGQRSMTYLQAATQAEQQGIQLVNAPGFKTWVTDTLNAASSAMVTASVVACITPWWVDALATFQVVFDKAWSVAKQVVGAVLAIGQTALKVAGDLPELYDILKWGALAGGAYWVWTRYLKKP